MLSAMLKEHQARQQQHRELQEKRRKDTIAAATAVTQALGENLNSGVSQAYVNQKKLDAEAKQLQTQAATYAKKTLQWLAVVEGFNQALKEIGDVENWARSIESDMRIISTALEYVYKDEASKPPGM
ncbi:biogenesis of lysosome-related organelles complex 1 subunit 1-like [Branchiostoma floridae x Branchiostoma belcheri]|nr:biogenesis of lysosome- organelles complex 1 subunit 1 [Branchiostoma belcheri]